MEYILNEYERDLRQHPNNIHNLHYCVEQLLECIVVLEH